MFFVQELTDLGFRPQDVALITWAPIFSFLGGVVGIFITYHDSLKAYEDAQKEKSFEHGVDIIAWTITRLFIALVAGLVLAFLMVSSLEVSSASVAKMFVLSVFSGLSAPGIFLMQQKAAFKRLSALFSSKSK